MTAKGEVVLALMASAPRSEDDFHFTLAKILPPEASDGSIDRITRVGRRSVTACDPQAPR